jgi:hypothetical protein
MRSAGSVIAGLATTEPTFWRATFRGETSCYPFLGHSNLVN